jgi:hypothetical protein
MGDVPRALPLGCRAGPRLGPDGGERRETASGADGGMGVGERDGGWRVFLIALTHAMLETKPMED